MTIEKMASDCITFACKVKRLLPKPRDETGSKSFMRFQFYGSGNKSYRFRAKRPGNATEQEIFWRGVYVGRSVW